MNDTVKNNDLPIEVKQPEQEPERERKLPVEVRKALVNDWILSPLTRGYCDKYFIAKWGGFYLFEQLIEGEVFKDGLYYKVRPMTHWHIILNAPSIGLSFRRARGNKDGFVLVDVWDDTPQGKEQLKKEKGE